jgi:NAD(P)-dependent dehydrogenase (short-subunit alcohol dehydrogenase family)
VNNAAFQDSQKIIGNIGDEQLERAFRTNIFVYFYMARAGIPYLKKRSAIVNTRAITGLEGNKHLLDCSSTKGAIHTFTKSVAQNLVEKGITAA